MGGSYAKSQDHCSHLRSSCSSGHFSSLWIPTYCKTIIFNDFCTSAKRLLQKSSLGSWLSTVCSPLLFFPSCSVPHQKVPHHPAYLVTLNSCLLFFWCCQLTWLCFGLLSDPLSHRIWSLCFPWQSAANLRLALGAVLLVASYSVFAPLTSSLNISKLHRRHFWLHLSPHYVTLKVVLEVKIPPHTF